MDTPESRQNGSSQLSFQPLADQTSEEKGSTMPTTSGAQQSQESNEPWHVVARFMSLLAVCQINNLFQLDRELTKNAPATSFAKKMQVKELDSRKKAELMVAQVLQTVSFGPTEAGWKNLGVIVDDVAQGRVGALEDEEWFEMAASFLDMASGAASWARELLPLSKLHRAMRSLEEPLEQLKGMGDEKALAVGAAISLCKAGLFLAVVNQSGRMSAIVGADGNRKSMASYEAELRQHTQSLSATGLVTNLEHFWQSIEMLPINIPFTPNPEFCGRSEAMEGLVTLLNGRESHNGQTDVVSENGSNPKVTAVCVWADEGMGKSQLALEYAHRHLANYHGALWVNASELCHEDSYLGLARHLRLRFDSGETVAEKLQIIRTILEDGRKILLILDNVERETTLARLLPQAGGAQVIVTSCAKVGTLPDLELPAMNFSEGLEVIKGSLQYKEAKGGALLESVEALQCFPLGLAIASHHSCSGLGPSTLLKLLKKDLPKKPPHSPWDRTFRKPSSVRNLLEGSLEQLKGPEGSLAVAMLEAAGWFGRHSVPVLLLVMAGQNLRAAQGQDPISQEQCQLAVDLLLNHKFATLDHIVNGLVFNSVLQSYAQTRKNSQLARSAVLAAVAGAMCRDVTAAHFIATWQLRRDFLGKPQEAIQITTVGLHLAQHWASQRKAEAAVAIWDEVVERKRFQIAPAIRARVRLQKAKLLLEVVGDKARWEQEVKTCLGELPKNQLESAAGLAAQVEQLWIEAENPRSDSRKPASSYGVTKSHLAGAPVLTALQSLAFRLCKNVVDRDETGPLGELQVVNDDDALLAEAMVRLTELLREHKLAPFGDYLGLRRRILEIRERVLPHTDPLLIDSMRSLGELYEELRELVESQQLLLEAFRLVNRGDLAGPGKVPGWGSAALTLADLHLSHEQRKEACNVYEITLAQADLRGHDDPLGEADTIANLSLMMQGPLTFDILEKARYNLEGAIADEGGGHALDLSSPRGRLFSSCKAKFGLVQFRLGASGQGLAGARKWIEESLVVDGELLATPRPLVALSKALVGSSGSAMGERSKELLRHRLVLLARLCIQGGELAEAKEHLEAAMALTKSGELRDGTQLGRISALLGAVEWLVGGEVDTILGLLNDALKTLKRELGEMNFEVADVLDCIGKAHETKAASGKPESWESASRAYGRSYAIREKLLGGPHPALAFSLASLMGVEAGQGHVDSAKQLRYQAGALLEGASEADLLELRRTLEAFVIEVHEAPQETNLQGI